VQLDALVDWMAELKEIYESMLAKPWRSENTAEES
jgi:hypothetical protein